MPQSKRESMLPAFCPPVGANSVGRRQGRPASLARGLGMNAWCMKSLAWEVSLTLLSSEKLGVLS